MKKDRNYLDRCWKVLGFEHLIAQVRCNGERNNCGVRGNHADRCSFAIRKWDQHRQNEYTNQCATCGRIYEHRNLNDTGEHADDVGQTHTQDGIGYAKRFDRYQLLEVGEFAERWHVFEEILPGDGGNGV